MVDTWVLEQGFESGWGYSFWSWCLFSCGWEVVGELGGVLALLFCFQHLQYYFICFNILSLFIFQIHQMNRVLQKMNKKLSLYILSSLIFQFIHVYYDFYQLQDNMFKSYLYDILQSLFSMIGIYCFVLALLANVAITVNTVNAVKTTNSFFGVILYANEDSQAKSFQCIVQSGLNLATQVIQSNIDSIEEPNIDLLYKAKTMFKAIDYIYASCRGRDPVEQVKQFMSKLPSELWSTVWILPEQDEGQCSATNYSKIENCDYIKKMLQQFSRNKIVAGVLADAVQWEKFAGDECNQIGSYPLHWFELDQNPFFTNFAPFGGWTQPKVKMYSGARICGIDIALTYRKQIGIGSLN